VEPEPRPDPDRRMPSGTNWVPQFQEDQKAWVDLFLNQNSEHRLKGYRTARDILLGEIMRFAVLGDAASAADVRGIYELFLRGGMAVDDRREILRHASDFQQGANLPANVYLPFICGDPDIGVCCTAVMSWVSEADLTDDDPMSRVKDVIDLIVTRRAESLGAVFGGLLHLGDPRVCALLQPLRDGLTDFEANEAIRSFTGFVSAAATEFLLD
jgi:hypothetical protein